jgi:hypothetical protein
MSNKFEHGAIKSLLGSERYTTYLELMTSGKVQEAKKFLNEIFEERCKEWHESDCELEVQEYLGLSWDEYKKLVKGEVVEK